MAQAFVLDARKVRIWLGATIAAPSTLLCALITKGFNQSKQSNTFVVPDCADPTIVAPVKRAMLSKDANIAGAGSYEPDKRGTIQTLFDASVSSSVSFELPNGEAPAVNSGYYTGKFFLTTWNITAEEGNLVQAEMTFEADGPWSWVAVP